MQLPFSLPAPAPTKLQRLVASCLDAGGAKPDVVAKRVRELATQLHEACEKHKDNSDVELEVVLRSAPDSNNDMDEGEGVAGAAEDGGRRVSAAVLRDQLWSLLKSLDDGDIDDIALVRRVARQLGADAAALEEECDVLGEEGVELVGRAVSVRCSGRRWL